MKFIEPADRSQYQLMSCIDDLVSADNPVRIIDMFVDSIVLNNPLMFHKERINEAGRPAFPDSIMLKLYLYGYFNGISSSRKLEAETYRNIELIWLLGGLKPDHWTISNYRKENGDKIKFLTKEFRKFLLVNGYIKLKTVAIDGSKVKAYASREMLTVEKINSKLEGIEKNIEEYLSRLSARDKRDDIIDEIEESEPEPESNKYLEKIIELQKKVEELENLKDILQREGRIFISPSDTEARLMKSRDGKIPAYNVQITVDAENKMIADSVVVTDEVDLHLLPQMIDSLKEQLGQVPEEAIADKGYNTPDLIESTENKEKGIQLYVSQEKTIRDTEAIKFNYNEEKDEYECSGGRRLILVRKNKKRRNSLANVYQGMDCHGCPLMAQCTSSPKGRTFHRYINQKHRDEFKAKMLSKKAKEKMALRKTMAEHPFGTIKYLMGKIPLLLRGQEKVTTEVNLYTTVYNFKRLFNIEPFDSLVMKIANYQWKTA